MFPSERQTIQETIVYSEPSPDSKVLVNLKKGVKLSISEGKRLTIGFSDFFFGKTPAGWALLQRDFEDFVDLPRCPICFDSNFEANDTATWCCNKQVHVDCLVRQVEAGFSGKMIGFNHLKCPCCTKPMDSNLYALPQKLKPLVTEVGELRKKINYLTQEADKDVEDKEKGGWAFFHCSSCEKPFCGGKVSCAEEEDLDTKELTCPECQWQLGAKDHRCWEHGRKYAIYKCDSCCAPASWSCTSNHYCERCHNQAGAKKFYPCLGGDKCPLGIPHPANIMANHMAQRTISFVIGCEKCCAGDSAVAYDYESCADAFEAPKDNVFSVFKYGARPKDPVCPVATPAKKKEAVVAPPPAPVVPVVIPAPIDPYEIDEDDESESVPYIDLFPNSDSDSDTEEVEGDFIHRDVEDALDEFDEPILANINDIEEVLENDLLGYHLFSDSEDESDESDEFDLKGFHLFQDEDSGDDDLNEMPEIEEMGVKDLFKEETSEDDLNDFFDNSDANVGRLRKVNFDLRFEEIMVPLPMVKAAS